MVKIVDNKIETDLYCKPTDDNINLLYLLAYPQKCRKASPQIISQNEKTLPENGNKYY